MSYNAPVCIGAVPGVLQWSGGCSAAPEHTHSVPSKALHQDWQVGRTNLDYASLGAWRIANVSEVSLCCSMLLHFSGFWNMLHLAEPISVSCLHLRYKKHVCHLMRKATEEIAQLKAIPKPLALSNRVRCLCLGFQTGFPHVVEDGFFTLLRLWIRDPSECCELKQVVYVSGIVHPPCTMRTVSYLFHC